MAELWSSREDLCLITSDLVYIEPSSNFPINNKIFKCNVCSLELPNEKRLENHKKVHARKQKSQVYEYGDPYLDYLGKQGIQAGFR